MAAPRRGETSWRSSVPIPSCQPSTIPLSENAKRSAMNGALPDTSTGDPGEASRAATMTAGEQTVPATVMSSGSAQIGVVDRFRRGSAAPASYQAIPYPSGLAVPLVW